MTQENTSSRAWDATVISGMTGENRTLTVTGEVEVGSPAQVPALREADSPDLNPSILTLELSVKDGGGAQVMTWKPVKFTRAVPTEQYETVKVRRGKEQLAEIEVRYLPSLG